MDGWTKEGSKRREFRVYHQETRTKDDDEDDLDNKLALVGIHPWELPPRDAS
jgi:hypothetical protein